MQRHGECGAHASLRGTHRRRSPRACSPLPLRRPASATKRRLAERGSACAPQRRQRRLQRGARAPACSGTACSSSATSSAAADATQRPAIARRHLLRDVASAAQGAGARWARRPPTARATLQSTRRATVRYAARQVRAAAGCPKPKQACTKWEATRQPSREAPQAASALLQPRRRPGPRPGQIARARARSFGRKAAAAARVRLRRADSAEEQRCCVAAVRVAKPCGDQSNGVANAAPRRRSRRCGDTVTSPISIM